ncbi:hypothetical protein A2867_01050 [Candidatus Daviesbacteria bacterium RIFCSPHIGHO2_01_FULL_40_11]|uniref:Uncharacterized protein n=1 Tax=Candidatus Daviesbacteria bacterium RIFCSPHIGHO2_01_FULL_40_11 TaxID=1797762 RepID=A0A1F5JHM1_9BACT|nr:MAG: hypothetical protein A2867_01050 [Candidatus Daviesbacteria bacterium RIFCSPHIGHO2_01_FULL_40_11]
MGRVPDIRGIRVSTVSALVGRTASSVDSLPANPGSVLKDGSVDDRGGYQLPFRSVPSPLSVRLRQVCDTI